MNIRWVVQTNLGKSYSEDLLNACSNLGIEFVPTQAIPFSDELPDVPNDKPAIFYGATRWINNIYLNNKWRPGVFFNPDSILPKWVAAYGHNALNYGAKITTLDRLKAEIDDGQYWEDRTFFLRPISDQKEFAGQVISAVGIWDWMNRVQTDVPDFGKTKIAVAEPVGIEREWRTFIVNGRVSSGSQYRRYGNSDVKCKLPKEVIDFAEARAKEYSPSPVFVMDIGRSNDNLYVIEIGCFNSAGFYASSVDTIVKDVSEYVLENGKK